MNTNHVNRLVITKVKLNHKIAFQDIAIVNFILGRTYIHETMNELRKHPYIHIMFSIVLHIKTNNNNVIYFVNI